MSGIAHFFETERGKRVKNAVIGVGASVVILGALFKILHWPGATQMLMIGMLVEAGLFALLGLLPPHKDYYWERVHPGLDIAPEVDKTFVRKNTTNAPMNEQVGNLMEKVGVSDEVFSRLGAGFEKIADNANKMSDISDAVAATNDYATSARSAANTLSSMNGAFEEAAENVKSIGAMGSGAQAFHEQIQNVTTNLASLNAMYELELQDTSSHLKAMNKYYGNMLQAMDNMNNSLEDSAKYKEQMAALSKNLSSLNNIYGNMLSAMSAGANR
ncbi:MAG: protein involved in gliding motility GldL [Bacteroidota bacterium]|jgi:gliding motility-associated protein GldL